MTTEIRQSPIKPRIKVNFGSDSIVCATPPDSQVLYLNRSHTDPIIKLPDSVQAKRAAIAAESPEHFILYQQGSDLFVPIDLELLCYRYHIIPCLFGLFLMTIKSDWDYRCKYPDHKNYAALYADLVIYNGKHIAAGVLG